MKVQYFAASTLDGFIATEDDSLEWLFTLSGLDNSSYPTFIANVGALVMGSATYEWILLDELIIQIGSVTLGKGKALFPRRVLAPTLKLISVHHMGEGMVELHYTVEPI